MRGATDGRVAVVTGASSGIGRATAHAFARRQGVCSLWGQVGSPYVSAYVASKFAIRGFSECIREELALAGTRDIHVCTVFPVRWTRRSSATPRTTPAARRAPCRRSPTRIRSSTRSFRASSGRARGARRTRDEAAVLLGSLAPGLVRRVVPRAFVTTALRRRGTEETPGNVLGSVPGLNAVRGGWK